MPSNNGDKGVFTLIREAARAGLERRAADAAAYRRDRALSEMQEGAFTEAAKFVSPDEDGFVPALDDQGRALDPEAQQSLQERALKASYRDLHAHGYLGTLRRFVMGEGPQVAFGGADDDEQLIGRIDTFADEFRRVNNWDQLEDEIPTRTWRDGEAFIRYFVHEGGRLSNGNVDRATNRTLAKLGIRGTDLARSLPEVTPGMTVIRLVPPDQISDPTGNIKHGIVTDREDAQTVLGYCWATDGNLRDIIRVDEMDHLKINVDSDVLRGRSMLEVLLKRLKEHEQWMDYRLALSMVRSAIALQKKVKGATPSQVSAIRDDQEKSRRDSPANNRTSKMLRPGTITTSSGIDYEFLTPNIQAQDAQHDGRSQLLSMAAATGMAEYMFTGDASNANFASTMVAESPTVREFEDWQDTFTAVFTGIHRRMLINAANANAIEGLTEQAAREMEIDIEWPPMQSSDELEHAKAVQLYRMMDILSKEGAAKDVGIDWEVEADRLEQERQEEVEFTGPAMGDEDGEGDGEE